MDHERTMRRRVLGALLLAACAVASPIAGAAYPDHAITIVVPFPAAGTTDILARVVAAQLEQRLHQSVVVENRPGAGGNIGTARVAKAAPDGYTLVMGTVGTHAINMSLYKDPGYDNVKRLRADHARGERAERAGGAGERAVPATCRR